MHAHEVVCLPTIAKNVGLLLWVKCQNGAFGKFKFTLTMFAICLPTTSLHCILTHRGLYIVNLTFVTKISPVHSVFLSRTQGCGAAGASIPTTVTWARLQIITLATQTQTSVHTLCCRQFRDASQPNGHVCECLREATQGRHASLTQEVRIKPTTFFL